MQKLSLIHGKKSEYLKEVIIMKLTELTKYSSQQLSQYGKTEFSLQTFRSISQMMNELDYKNYELKVEVLNGLGCVYRRIKRYKECFNNLNQALKLAKVKGINTGISETNLAALWNEKGEYNKGLIVSMSSIAELSDLYLDDPSARNAKLLSIAYYNNGLINSNLKNSQKAKEAFERALKYLNDKRFDESLPLIGNIKFQLMKLSKNNPKRKRKDRSLSRDRKLMHNLRGNSYQSKIGSKNRQERFSISQSFNLKDPKKLNSNLSTISVKGKKKENPYEFLDSSKGVKIRERKKKDDIVLHNHNLSDFRTKLLYCADEKSRKEDKVTKHHVTIGTNLSDKKYDPYRDPFPIYNLNLEKDNKESPETNPKNHFNKNRNNKSSIGLNRSHNRKEPKLDAEIDEQDFLSNSWDEEAEVQKVECHTMNPNSSNHQEEEFSILVVSETNQDRTNYAKSRKILLNQLKTFNKYLKDEIDNIEVDDSNRNKLSRPTSGYRPRKEDNYHGERPRTALKRPSPNKKDRKRSKSRKKEHGYERNSYNYPKDPNEIKIESNYYVDDLKNRNKELAQENSKIARDMERMQRKIQKIENEKIQKERELQELKATLTIQKNWKRYKRSDSCYQRKKTRSNKYFFIQKRYKNVKNQKTTKYIPCKLFLFRKNDTIYVDCFELKSSKFRKLKIHIDNFSIKKFEKKECMIIDQQDELQYKEFLEEKISVETNSIDRPLIYSIENDGQNNENEEQSGTDFEEKKIDKVKMRNEILASAIQEEDDDEEEKPLLNEIESENGDQSRKAGDYLSKSKENMEDEEDIEEILGYQNKSSLKKQNEKNSVNTSSKKSNTPGIDDYLSESDLKQFEGKKNDSNSADEDKTDKPLLLDDREDFNESNSFKADSKRSKSQNSEGISEQEEEQNIGDESSRTKETVPDFNFKKNEEKDVEDLGEKELDSLLDESPPKSKRKNKKNEEEKAANFLSDYLGFKLQKGKKKLEKIPIFTKYYYHKDGRIYLFNFFKEKVSKKIIITCFGININLTFNKKDLNFMTFQKVLKENCDQLFSALRLDVDGKRIYFTKSLKNKINNFYHQNSIAKIKEVKSKSSSFKNTPKNHTKSKESLFKVNHNLEEYDPDSFSESAADKPFEPKNKEKTKKSTDKLAKALSNSSSDKPLFENEEELNESIGEPLVAGKELIDDEDDDKNNKKLEEGDVPENELKLIKEFRFVARTNDDNKKVWIKFYFIENLDLFWTKIYSENKKSLIDSVSKSREEFAVENNESGYEKALNKLLRSLRYDSESKEFHLRELELYSNLTLIDVNGSFFD